MVHYNRLCRAMSMMLVGLASSFSVAEPTTRPVPDLGLIINVDGDNAFPADTLAESTTLLKAEIARYADARVRTLCYSTGAGSDIMLYPTRVADTWGFRSTSYDENPAWKDRIARMRKNMAEGGDALRTAGAQAKALGMFFFPSQRMNDAHYAFGKPVEDYPLAGSFWLKNRDLVIRHSPIASKPEYGELLDFSHQKVREYRLAQINEAIERYQDIIDGFELDFTRFQIFFPAGRAEANAPMMTELVERVRQRLDAVEKDQGRPMTLIVRVPPSLANSRWAGLEVDTWMKRRLVDVVVPSQMMTMGFEQPIDEFKAVGGGAKVYSGLLPRVTWSFPFTAPTENRAPPDRALTVEQLRGAVANATALGADGLYLFNFQHYTAWANPERGKSIDLSQPSSLPKKSEVFSITKAYWADNENGYEYRKQLPAVITPSSPQKFTMFVGSNLNIEPPATAWLRVGLREPPEGASLRIEVNGKMLANGVLKSLVSPSFDYTDAKVSKQVKSLTDLPTHFALLKLDPSSLVKGTNEVRLTIDNTGAFNASVTDIDVGVFRP